MSDQENKVDTTDARKESMSRVVTNETLFKQISAANPTTQDSTDEKVEDVKHEESETKLTGKKSAQERIQELANKRRDAEAKADAKERENEELRERIKRLETTAPQIEATDRPKRTAFSSQEDYEDALIDWKAEQKIAQREEQQRQAKMQSKMAEIDSNYEKRIKEAKDKYDDFIDVVSKASINVPPYAALAIKKNKNGADITYYLSKHQKEAQQIFEMDADDCIAQLLELGKEFNDEPIGEPVIKKVAAETKKKAPEPINALAGKSLIAPSTPKEFESYRAKRLAEMRK